MCALALAFAPSASASGFEGLASTPYMGVDTWYAFGTAINEQTIVELANAMVSSGLRAAGYRYLWIDGGWWTGTRDAQGNIVVDPAQWPHGMQWVVAYIHSMGLLAGIYTDAGNIACGKVVHPAGSYGRYQQDVDTFASWGFDAVKVDFCGGDSLHLDPAATYRAFGEAILNDEPRRPMLFNICNAGLPNEYGAGLPSYSESAYSSYTYGPAIANSWRTGPDLGIPGDVQYPQVISNFELDATHPGAAGPGHWNDPDYLVPNAGMTPAEAQSEFTLWVVLAAPLVVSADVMTMPEWTRAMLINRAAIAIDQDPLGVQARLVSRSGGTEVWTKRLSGRAGAVAVLNQGLQPATVRLTRGMLGVPATRPYSVLDVWADRTFVAGGPVLVSVAPGTAVLLRVVPRRRVSVNAPGRTQGSRRARGG